jgi:hypothetical protein
VTQGGRFVLGAVHAVARLLVSSAARRIQVPSLHGSEAGERGGLGAMTHREHLAQADRFIAECKNRIARQREIIATAYENGHPTGIPVSMLRALEENLRSFEKHRHLILNQLKTARHSRAPAAAS